MRCPLCGTAPGEKTKFCFSGGSRQRPGLSAPAGASLVGFSPKISDPALARYVRHRLLWPVIFASILAAVAIVGFYIYGERSAEMDNPQALHTGLVVGGMYLAIALCHVLGRNKEKTWDGTVEDKRISRRRRRRRYSEGYADYLEYTVVIRSDRGKKYLLRAENDSTRYNYYRIGDRVRHHEGLNSYEKYDKSGDEIIFCNACATLCKITDEHCFRCRCPLLK